MVDYVSPKRKIKFGQFRMNKIYNSRCLLRILQKLDYLSSIQINRSTNNFIFSRSCSRCKENKILERFLDNRYEACQLYQIYPLNTSTRTNYSNVAGSSRVYLSSLVSMLLFIKVMVLKQTLESVRTRYNNYSGLSKRVRFRIGLATESVVLYLIWITTFLTFSALSATSMCWISPVPAIATLSN